VGFIVFLFLRHQIRDLLPVLDRIKYKDLELNFGREVEEIKGKLTAKGLGSQSDVDEEDVEAYFENLVDISSRAAIHEGWIDFETTVASSLRALGLLSTRNFVTYPNLISACPGMR